MRRRDGVLCRAGGREDEDNRDDEWKCQSISLWKVVHGLAT